MTTTPHPDDLNQHAPRRLSSRRGKYLQLPEPKTPFQAWLVGEMRRLGLTQAELARRSGMTTSIVAAVFAGKRGQKEPSARLIVRLAQAVQVSPLVVLAAAGLIPAQAENNAGVIERTCLLTPENRHTVEKIVDLLLASQADQADQVESA